MRVIQVSWIILQITVHYLPRSFFKLISEGGSESIGTLINV